MSRGAGVVRVTDGLSLAEAMQRSFTEASKNRRDFGAIAWGKTNRDRFYQPECITSESSNCE